MISNGPGKILAMRSCLCWILATLIVPSFPARAAALEDEQSAPAAPQPATELPSDAPLRYRLQPPYADPSFQDIPNAEQRKNYLIPLAEVVTINLLIWGWNYAVGKDFAKISWESIKQNFRKGWIVDTDDFWANQMLHPYHGSLTFNAARSMGLNFYESFGYAFAGSLMWEQFMEIQPPSLNDQVNTPFGGTMLGEVLFRMHRLVLDSGGAHPGGWRRFFALLISPMAGLNELATGDAYRGPLLLPQTWMGEFHAGAVIAGSTHDDRSGVTNTNVGPWASVGAHVLYGVPGTRGLVLRAPFDHFDFQGALAFTDTAQPSADLLIRGLLVGATLGGGGRSGGLWGLFTSYDFISASVFRASGFGVGPGVSLMKRWDTLELHGTALGELLPWSGGGSVDALGARDYHYGTGAEALLELRLHVADRAIIRLSGREFFISGNYARGLTEDVTYGAATATIRLVGPHSVTAELIWSRRHAQRPASSDVDQNGLSFATYYTLLSGW
jgi:Domain of unknown function (DUF3943)